MKKSQMNLLSELHEICLVILMTINHLMCFNWTHAHGSERKLRGSFLKMAMARSQSTTKKGINYVCLVAGKSANLILKCMLCHWIISVGRSCSLGRQMELNANHHPAIIQLVFFTEVDCVCLVGWDQTQCVTGGSKILEPMIGCQLLELLMIPMDGIMNTFNLTSAKVCYLQNNACPMHAVHCWQIVPIYGFSVLCPHMEFIVSIVESVVNTPIISISTFPPKQSIDNGSPLISRATSC